MPDQRRPLVVIGPASVEPGIAGGAMHTFAAFRAAVDDAGLGATTVDTGAASVPRWAARAYKPFVAVRLVAEAVRLVVRPAPVIWFMSAGMLRTLSPLVAVASLRSPVVVMTFGGWLGEMVPNLAPWHRRVVVASLNRARLVAAQSRRTVALATAAGVRCTASTGVMRGWPALEARLDGTDHPPPLRLAYAGRIERRKGIVALAELVRASGGALTVDAMGPLDDDPELAALVESPPDGMRFLGRCPPEEVLRRLRDADLSVLLSTYPGEGLPGAVVESLQVGTPVLVSDHLALPELVDDGMSGFVIPAPDDGASWPIDELAARLTGLEPDDLATLRRGAVAAGDRHRPDRWLPLLLEPLGVDITVPVPPSQRTAGASAR